MHRASTPAVRHPAPPLVAILSCAAVAVGSFHLAYGPGPEWLAAVVPFGLVPLAFLSTARRTFYSGLMVALALYAPRLAFFWGIFGAAAVFLWIILAFWVGLALALIRASRLAWGDLAAVILAPVLWMGTEYFRSELYYLRFSWLNAGFALVDAESVAAPARRLFGVYGIGFLFFAAASTTWFAPGRWRMAGPCLAALALILPGGLRRAPGSSDVSPAIDLNVAGAQIESLPPAEIPAVLDRLIALHPGAQLLVLPEYSLDREPEVALRDWCRRHRRHLIVGGRESLPSGQFRNTAFVIDPEGEIVFRQAKSVPIQFFDDGLPAADQALWNSPWGPLGIAICYDLSYSRVIDRLVRLGAVALIVPTMDAISWGAAQHRLHARVAPVRAAEYGLPIVRVASSGISQIVDAAGRVTAAAPFGDDVVLLAGTVRLAGRGSLPLDRWLAPACTGASVLVALVLMRRNRRTRRLS